MSERPAGGDMAEANVDGSGSSTRSAAQANYLWFSCTGLGGRPQSGTLSFRDWWVISGSDRRPARPQRKRAPTREESIRQDVADLAALIRHLGLGGVAAGNCSAGRLRFGWLANARPPSRNHRDEPPLFSLLANDPSRRRCSTKPQEVRGRRQAHRFRRPRRRQAVPKRRRSGPALGIGSRPTLSRR